ncbi:MAG TPA: NADH-quinone oxidoreductase subunit H [Polyangium sp.]|nr:NADH-quinone oxidoreductase subunit H [Polyangium sp.]
MAGPAGLPRALVEHLGLRVASGALRPKPHHALVTLGFFLTLLGGCQSRDGAPDLLRVLDVAPREIEVGDRFEVIGTNLPTGDAREATITLHGSLHRPGEAPITDQTIFLGKARLSTEHVSANVTEAIISRVCGQGDDASHTTFHGDVTVTLDTRIDGALPVAGTVKNITLDARPKAPRHMVARGREADGKRTLDFLGLAVSEEGSTTSGLVITAVRPDSPAAQAKIVAGDVITNFDGVTVTGISDMIPSGAEREPILSVRRGADEIVAIPISIENFHANATNDLLGGAIVLGVFAALLVLVSTRLSGLLAWFARRLAFRVVAPGATPRPRSLTENVIHVVRSEITQHIIPRNRDPILSYFAPVLSFVGVSATFVVMPFARKFVGAELDVGVLFLIALTALVGLAFVTGGSLAHEPWSLGRGFRGAWRTFLQQIPALAALACVVFATGSIKMDDIVAAQAGQGGALIEVGGWPWHWFVFRNPATLVLFATCISALVTSEAHASNVIAEADPATNSAAPATTTRWLLYMFGEWAHVFIVCGIVSALFLGGWQLPGVHFETAQETMSLRVVSAVAFLLKSWALVFFVIWLRYVLPRLGSRERARVSLRWIVPTALVCLALTTGFWEVLPLIGLGRNAGFVIATVTFVVWAFGTGFLAWRVKSEVSSSRSPLHVNPII